MEHPMSPARLVRGLLICTAGVLPAVGAHVAAGGSAVPSFLLLMMCLGLVAALAAASGREWSTRSLVATLALTQGLVHAALWLTGGHHGHVGLSQATTPPTATPLHGGASMVLWHAIAVAMSAIALRHGERLIHLFARLVNSLPRAMPVATLLPAPHATRVVYIAPVALRPLVVLLGAVDRRGPPMLIPAL